MQSIYHPPAERREMSLNVLKELEYLGVLQESDVCERNVCNMQKEKSLLREEERSDLRVVIASHVYLDRKSVCVWNDDKQTFTCLERLFENYSTSNSIPCFILIGDFISPAFSQGSGCQDV